jgi:hypothetical protein
LVVRRWDFSSCLLLPYKNTLSPEKVKKLDK